MTTRILRPEESLLDELRAGIARSRECLFTVAYLDDSTANELTNLVRDRLAKSKVFRFRLLVRTTDYFTAPAALMQFMSIIPRGARDRMQLRYSTHDKFHAKAFGFRDGKNRPPTVVIGSANLLARAVAADSGELGVVLQGNQHASEGWHALESFWAEGTPITPAWLRDYDKRWRRIEKRRDAVRTLVARQPKTLRRNDLAVRAPIPTSLYVYITGWISPARQKEITFAARDAGVSLPENYYDSTPAIARALPRDRAFLDLTWTNDRLDTIALVRVAAGPAILLHAAKATILPWHIVRGTFKRLTRHDRDILDRAIAAAGLGPWFKRLSSGYLRSRRLPLLKALAKIGWKPAASSAHRQKR